MEEGESAEVGAPVRLKREILSEEEPAFAARMSPDLGLQFGQKLLHYSKYDRDSAA